jgi:RsiW-degrading membrane proteinase PrsW (M82 family)
LFALWPVLVYVGFILPIDSYSRMLLLPFIHVLSVVIPIFGLLWLGCQRLVTSSHQRNAGLLSSGLVLGTSLSMIIEVALMIFGFIVLVVVLVADPQLALKFSHMADQINSANMDSDAILRIIGPSLTSPLTLAILLGFISVATPLIEEICKPIGLWFFARRGLTPRDGFIGGMLSGAGFTLVETLLNGLQEQPYAWLMIVTLRIGTGALHIFASGLMGYSMVKAWSSRNYWNLFFGYLVSVSLHGLWNAMAILFSLTQAVPPEQGSLLEGFGKASPYGMAVLSILFISGLYFFNRKLRAEQTVSSASTPSLQAEG